jgi:hypothetical protein
MTEPTKQQIKAWQLRLIDSALSDIHRDAEWELYQSGAETAKWVAEILEAWKEGAIYAPDAEEIESTT